MFLSVEIVREKKAYWWKLDSGFRKGRPIRAQYFSANQRALFQTSSPVMQDPVPATPFELKQIEFPTLGPIATDSPTPPPPNSKEIFDDLKPANNKLGNYQPIRGQL